MNFEMIPAKELDRYTDRQDTFLIDVRPPEEYQQSHIRGAVNIPACLDVCHCLSDLVGLHPLVEHREHGEKEDVCERQHSQDYRLKAHPDVELYAPEEFHQLASNLYPIPRRVTM